jgi:hypothetical protein
MAIDQTLDVLGSSVAAELGSLEGVMSNQQLTINKRFGYCLVSGNIGT